MIARDEWNAEFAKYNRAGELRTAFLISLRRRYVYRPIAKVANSTIRGLLYEAEFKANGFHRHVVRINSHFVHNPFTSPLLQPYQLTPNLMERALFSDRFFRFAFVRNPVDRVLSCYLDRVQAPNSVPHMEARRLAGSKPDDSISFDQFVDVISQQENREMNHHWRPQYHQLMCGIVKYTEILRLEDFDAAMKKMLEKFYPKIAPTIDMNKMYSPRRTKAKEMAITVSPETRKKIEKIYKEDFEFFGY